jgi:hypothetical protein
MKPMSGALETAKFAWSVVENGAPKVDVTPMRVSALPQGSTKADLPGPWRNAAYTENLEQKEWLAGIVSALGLDPDLIKYAIAAVWDYNGQHISDFHISASGNVQPLSNLSITAQTFEADQDADGVVQMKYDIICMMSNITSGSTRLVMHALARGDGGGMSLAEEQN